MDETNGSLGNQPAPNAGGVDSGSMEPAAPDVSNSPVTPNAPISPDASSASIAQAAPVTPSVSGAPGTVPTVSSTPTTVSEVSVTPSVIASTPDVVAPVSDEQVAAAAAKLAPSRPFFSDHPAQVAASGTGDIILQKTKTPRDKKPLIIGAVVLGVVALVGGIVLLANRPASSEDVKVAFDAYYDLLANGPAGAEVSSEDGNTKDTENSDEADESEISEGSKSSIEFQVWDNYDYEDEDEEEDTTVYDDEDDEEEEYGDPDEEDASDDVVYNEEPVEEIEYEPREYSKWFVFGSDSYLTLDSKKTYIDDILKKYDEFSAILSRSKKDNVYEQLQNIMPIYSELLKAVMLTKKLDAISIELEKRFLEGGTESAEKYIDEAVSTESDDAFVTALIDSLRSDLKIQLQLVELYSQNQCIEDGYVNYACDLDGNQKYDQLLNDRDTNTENSDMLLDGAKITLYTQTVQMKEMLAGEKTDEE